MNLGDDISNNKKKIKIAILILATSKKRDSWVNIKDSYLFNMTLKSFLTTFDREHDYIFYVGIDKDDRIFSKREEQEEIIRFNNVFKNIEFVFMTMDEIPKGHVTQMWNRLFSDAYKRSCDYYYQCGDDMEFTTKGWINDCIKVLKSNNDIGLAGPINNNNRILTQAFVSYKHMDIFGWFFPIEIKNWCCDDWYNMVYHPQYLYPLYNHFAVNLGGEPRYDINNNPNFTDNELVATINVSMLRKNTLELANKHKDLIEQYIKM
jgi:hypothetical protein